MVFKAHLSEDSHGQRYLAGYSPADCKESDESEHMQRPLPCSAQTCTLPGPSLPGPSNASHMVWPSLPGPSNASHVVWPSLPGFSQPLKCLLPPPARKTRPEELPEHPGGPVGEAKRADAGAEVPAE